MTGNERWTKACAEDDVPFLEGRRVEVGGFYVGVFNTEEGFYAVYDVCPHRGGPLSDREVARPSHMPAPRPQDRPEDRRGAERRLALLHLHLPVEMQYGSVHLDMQALASRGAPTPA